VVSLEDLKKIFRGEIRISEQLSGHTWLQIGGPADYYLEPFDKEDAVSVVQFFREQSFPFMIIGRGSNLLVSDDGYRGAVINLEKALNRLVKNGSDIIIAEAGVRLSTFVDFCIKDGYAGTEMLAGIPGTIGGAVRMNAGAYGGELADFLLDVEVIREGRVVRVKKDEAGFAYRQSSFSNDVILEARFRFPKKDKEDLARIRRELLIKRNAAQPVHLPNSGSIFKNPSGFFAAKLIQDCGLKGTIIGGAQISELHANFIVNRDNATARDVFELMVLMRNSVYKKFNLLLENEVLLIGFAEEDRIALTGVPAGRE
jgi:UDP-N-acetylmuramate dehydrogenase